MRTGTCKKCSKEFTVFNKGKLPNLCPACRPVSKQQAEYEPERRVFAESEASPVGFTVQSSSNGIVISWNGMVVSLEVKK